MPIRKEDIVDADFIDAPELIATGTTNYVSGVSIASTVGVSQQVIVTGFNLLLDDTRVSPGDRLTISGGTPNDGIFTVATIIDNQTLTTVESLVNSTGGTAAFAYPSGAKKVGFNSTGLTVTNANNVQDAIFDLAQEVESSSSGGGFTDGQHSAVRQLIHFIDEGPAEGFLTGAFKEILPAGNPFPTQMIWWTSSAKTSKIVDKTIVYNSNKTVDSVTWQIYLADGTTVAGTIADAISYSGVFEANRTRAITVNVAPSGVAITESSHRVLRQLIHFINEGPAEGFATGAFKEILPLGAPFPTSVTWWESSAKLKKIVDKVITYNSNKTVNTVTWHVYDVDGVTALSTVSDTHSYSGIFETDRTRSIS